MPMPEAEHSGSGTDSPFGRARVCLRCHHRVTLGAPYCHYCGVRLWWGQPSIRTPVHDGLAILGKIVATTLLIGAVGCFGLFALTILYLAVVPIHP